MKCRHCHSDLRLPFIDLGSTPPSNAYLEPEDLDVVEKTYPLRVMVCERCWLVQTEDFADAEEFFSSDYAYFSSFSSSWLSHAAAYAESVTADLDLDSSSFVVEVASNDGYLLGNFVDAGIPCLGVEPTKSTADVARSRGIPVIEEFFGVDLARHIVEEHGRADLIAANNVLAHVPDINDFVSGFTELLKPEGVATFEFPHLVELVKNQQFDTIYHEHFSYLSLTSVTNVLESNGLQIFDVEKLSTHGGSLRVHARRQDDGLVDPSVGRLFEEERRFGVSSREWYGRLQGQAERMRLDLIRFLEDAKQQGRKVVGYGAAAKGNTLLNFAGVDTDLVEYVVDRNPAKQGRFMPGSRIPILAPEAITETRPDYLLVLPWNLLDEVMQQLADIRSWGGRFVTAVPELKVQ